MAASAPENNECKLFALAQELQDKIFECIFTDEIAVDANVSKHPFLRAIEAKQYKEQYAIAEKAYYANATFSVRLGMIPAFIKASASYLHLIKEIRISPATFCRFGQDFLRIPTAGDSAKFGHSMDYINFAMSMNAMMRAEEISMRWIGQLETSITKQGVNAGVLKLAVAIMDDEEVKEVVWTAEPVKDMRVLMEKAGYMCWI